MNKYAVSNQKKPLAIAMWDFSWILRHHRAGEFADWDKVLDELAERGYNAIRIDAMPHLVAPDMDGTITEEYHIVKDDWKPEMWGNNCSIRVRPREALLEFLPKCYERGIHVGLASWCSHLHRRLLDVENGLFHAWENTLTFLHQNGLLDRALYVDVLNEYPLWHGFSWLKKGFEDRADEKKFKEKNPNVFIPDADAFIEKGKFTTAQKQFYNSFLTKLLTQLKKKWPKLDFFASLDPGMPLEDIDLSAFSALDYHLWFNYNPEMRGFRLGALGPNDNEFEQIQKNLNEFWAKNRTRMIDWISGRIKSISEYAAKNKIPCGNTEGWGSQDWLDHPSLTWDFIKESGEICVDLALQNGYKFICTSNFTHPQFPSLWQDVKWHRKLTSRICG